jgi:hypothetical protein
LTPIFSGFIRDDPPHLRHPRSINPYTDVKTDLGEETMRTLCFALRLLMKTNTFKSVAVLTLVSGLGANVIAGRRLPENPPWQATAEEEKRGRDLLSQVITAMGGGQKIDELTSYADVHKATAKLPQGDQEVGGRWIIEFVRGHAGVELPDRVREEVTVDGPQGKRLTVKVYGPGNSFVADQGRIHQLTEDRRLEWMMSLQQHPLMLLRARALPRFRVAAAGNSQVDGRAVHLLLVEVYGRRLTLGIDAESRRILTVSFRDKDWHTGVPGQFVVRYSDYRIASGLVLPFRHDYFCDGRLLLTGILESITLNQKIDPKLYEKP